MKVRLATQKSNRQGRRGGRLWSNGRANATSGGVVACVLSFTHEELNVSPET